jgi:sulfate adenylyltransferase large subunit
MLALSHFTTSESEKPLLRISTAGSVDDGKSTLIGRLLHDTRTVWEDQLEELGRSTVNRASRGLDFSLLTDGLRAEREQGITIDVAYRYFATPRRKFIVADTPGHEQYTRNMATGASTAGAAIILLDARKGVLPQSRRHAYIAWLLGVRRLIFAVNKMDLAGFSREVFAAIREQAGPLLALLEGAQADFIPVSALDGDNVVEASPRTPWYEGPSLLELLETLEPPAPAAARAFRFPVQLVIRPHLDFRGYAGQIASGRVRAGDSIVALPSGRHSRVKRIVTFDGDLDEAFAPMSVTLELEDELDIARGDMLAAPAAAPTLARRAEAMLVWMNEAALAPGRTYLLQHGPRTVPARVERILYRWDVNTLEPQPAGALDLNEIGRVLVETAEPLAFDSYRDDRATGGFILIDPINNLTLGAGLIEAAVRRERRGRAGVEFRAARLTAAERQALFGHRGAVVDLAARPDLAPLLERQLLEQGHRALLLEIAGLPAEALADAGQIVITTVPAASPLVQSADLSADDDEALLELHERLRRSGVFLIQDDVEPGEGI